MTELQVVHHTDYRSKAEDRKKELEKLQEKGLARTKAARLRDAQVPTEACTFLEKQRELFAVRRKNRADAIEFLHQFRADDDYVLRKTRHSLGSQKEKYSTSCNSSSRYSLPFSRLDYERQPDARASVYSPVMYPLSNSITDGGSQEHDDTPNESSSLELFIHSAEIIEDSICFESTYKNLEIAAKEASRIPIPENDDGFVVNIEEHDNRDNNNGNLISGESDCIFSTQPSTIPFIPSEAFSKLGGSLEMDSKGLAECGDNNVCESLAECDSDDDSIIPGESFRQLGASMVANDLSPSLHIEEQKSIDENILQQNAGANLDMRPNTTTYSSALQIAPNTNLLLLEQINSQASSHSLYKSTYFNCGRLEKKGLIESVMAVSETNDDKRKMKLCEDGEFSLTVVSRATNIGDHNNQNSKVSEPEVDFKYTKNTEKLIMPIDSGAATSGTVCQINRTPKKSNLSVSGRNIKETDSINVSREEEKLLEIENCPKVNSEMTRETKQNPRRNRKKKKNEDKSYYPSSSLFVCRQFLSR